jgi:alpha-N-arabinofuranosidase
VNWKQVGHAIDRPSQLNHEGAGVSRGLFAPAITYHNGLFYIVCTQIDKGGNFVITAKDPAGPWSDPVWIPQVTGIDPSLFIEDNGKSFIVYNSVPPGNISQYDGHRTIRMYEFDINNLKVIGDEMLLVNGGTDITKKPVWIEAPHIFRKEDWYYLICAEGGTGYNHSEVVFRSRSLEEPFISYKGNPILTQRHLDPARKNPVTTTGHADFVETPEGKWFAVFLGCRPYEGNHYNIGRETFMAPVKWEDGWPIILEGNEVVKTSYPVPIPGLTEEVNNPFSGQIIYRDEFDSPTLNKRWSFLRTTGAWLSHSKEKNAIIMQVRPETCTGLDNPSFIGFRQQNHTASAEVLMEFNPASSNEKAGMVIFQNETHFYYLCKSMSGDKPVVQLFISRPDSTMLVVESINLPNETQSVYLRISMEKSLYKFEYSVNGQKWKSFSKSMDAKFLSTSTAGGFVGCMYGLYATSQWRPSNSTATFNYFQYRGKD